MMLMWWLTFGSHDEGAIDLPILIDAVGDLLDFDTVCNTQLEIFLTVKICVLLLQIPTPTGRD